MPLNFQLYGLAVKIQGQGGPHGKFFGTLQCPLRKGLHEARVVKEFAFESSALKKIQRPPSKPFR